jgi:heme A synthase
MIHAHSLLRWVVLILALITIIKSFSGMSSKKAFGPSDRKFPLFFMIAMDIQLLLGLVLYFTKPLGFENFKSIGMANVMANTSFRFVALEHPVGMLLAIIFAHIAFKFTKKSMDDTAKFKKIFLFSLLSLVVMLATIPWPFREAIARPLFPGM